MAMYGHAAELSVTRMKGRLVYYSVTGELIVDQSLESSTNISWVHVLTGSTSEVHCRDDRWSGFLIAQSAGTEMIRENI